MMAQKVRTTFIAIVVLIVFLASVYHYLVRHQPVISAQDPLLSPPGPLYPNPKYAIRHEDAPNHESNSRVNSAVSILLPAWEILVVVSTETPLPLDSNAYTCLFPNNDTSPARPAGILPSLDRNLFKCDLPVRLRRRLPFPQPILTKSPENPPEIKSPASALLRWNFLVYDSLTTENDVILFVKGVNNRQGIHREPSEFRCVFGDDAIHGVRTAVKSSLQEVFRCPRPERTGPVDDGEPVKVSLEISDQKLVMPSVAYYTPARKIALQEPKSPICACTLVYNAAKFLKEWVVYHSEIGVQKFFLYDNDSDDDLEKVVTELVDHGYNVSTLFWPWPKTQEAGFSHCAIHANDSCAWMMYMDVDEFIYSPNWLNSSTPSDQMLPSLLPTGNHVGQVIMNCYEFGPSNQKSHPVLGVTQGYNCRNRVENRHKSIVLLNAIDASLLNVIHHFKVREGYRTKNLGMDHAVVNHYKFQAWEEFKTKFRRRVSAYVVDWTQAVNLDSKDRTPGLGYAAVEPKGWAEKFCEVYDNRLRDMTRRWFGMEAPSGNHMAWQI
ncbi:Glycosyltransferase family 92 protein [Actinidia chinensis var. chinensis]|uniref:Glycosyltransferase family 92 protein n=1 Tax=Actinidia chinensis var. chinensis TaxID=1590841 RepID=A0A2R6QXU7_ACTCC|nr:Glycosyltransferase family 92 protein [Actinidia chinensis var. chinensis]